jgi:hypothetical protein
LFGRDPLFGLKDPDGFYNELLELSTRIHFWPPLREVRRAGEKLRMMKDLDAVAATITKTPRLTSSEYTGGCLKAPIVLKRERSESAAHVIIRSGEPNCKSVITQEDVEKRGGMRYKWFVQPYNPLIRRFGEWRVFLVDCQPKFVVHTWPDPMKGWRFDEWTRGYTLEEMK